MTGRAPKGVTKSKILKAARKLFVAHGYAGTSMGMIRDAAGVNHSLLFHYFTNKANLWAEVKQDICESSDEVQINLPSLSLKFNEFIEELTKRQINFYKKQPDLVRLINWQRMEIKSKDENLGITQSKQSLEWIEAFKHYQKLGEINPNLNPAFILTFHLSICMSAVIDANVFIEKKNDFDNYIKFSVDMMIKCLSSP